MNPVVSRGSRSSTSSLASSTTFSSASAYSSPLTDFDHDDGSFRPTKHLPSFFPPTTARHSSASPAPSASSSSAASMSTRSTSSSSKPQRKERQTRLQEHLRTVKSSRGISPAAMAKSQAKQQPQQQQPETVTSGRPKRKAATKVVMQEVDTDSELDEDAEEDEEDGSDAAEQEEEGEEEEEPEEKPQPATRRGGRRSIPTPKRAASASTEDFAPAVSNSKPAPSSSRKSPAKATPSKKSPAKKSPSKQPPSKSSNPRQREISNLSIDVDGMNAAQVEMRLSREKDELMQRLAQHGIIPQADVLDRALRSMTDSNEKLTVDSFLRTLSSLNTSNSGGVQPLPLPPAPLALQVSPPPAHSNAKRVTFSTLESPSTPSTAEHPIFALPSPPRQQQQQPQGHFAGAPVSLLPSPPAFVGSGGIEPSLAGQQAHHHLQQRGQQPQQAYANPAQLRAARLAAFANNRSHSAPAVPTLALPTPPASAVGQGSGQGLFAAQVDGMGRVALSRRNPFGGPPAGPPAPPPQPVYQQPHHPLPLPHPHPHQHQQHRPSFPPAPQHHAPRPSPALSLLPAFNGASSLSGLPKRPRAPPAAVAGGTDDRLAKLKSWLDDDDDTTEDEDAGLSSGKKDAAAELTLKAKAGLATSSSSISLNEKRRLEPAMKLVDAPGSDEEEEGMEIRVGGKSVTILRKSHKRQLEEDEAASAAQAAPKSIVTPVKQKQPAVATRSTRSKGKQKAASECLCGEKVVVEEEAGEEESTKRCSECEVVFHVSCLNVASPRLLPSGWACERCSRVDAASSSAVAAAVEIDRPSTPPSVPLSAKRVRIGTTSTPIFPGQEPTFVMSSTFSPAPRRNNDFSDCADMALAPSPTASPVRQFAAVPPTSPLPSKVSIPVTPQFGEATLLRSGGSGAGYTGDYSPHSPLTHRQRRARVASNGGGGAFSEFLNGGWDGLESAGAAAAASSDDYHLHSLGHALPAWSDVTMTPSRALASSSSGIGMTPHSGGTHASSSSALWDSPFSSSAGGGHHRRPSFTLSGGSAHLRTPSNLAGDIFSLGGGGAAHSAPAPHSSSRLFAAATAQHDSLTAQDPFAPSLTASPSFRPTSPLNPRRTIPGSSTASGHPHHHRRTPSSTLGGSASALQSGAKLAGPWSPTPSASYAHSSLGGHGGGNGNGQPFSWLHERRPSGAGSVGMKVSHSMPGLRSLAGGAGAGGGGAASLSALSVGFDGHPLDDIAF